MKFTLNDIKNAQIELVNGAGEGSGIYANTIESTYADNSESYIDEVRYPISLVKLLTSYAPEDIETFRIKVDGIIYNAYDIGGEYLAVDESSAFTGATFSFFAIDSII